MPEVSTAKGITILGFMQKLTFHQRTNLFLITMLIAHLQQKTPGLQGILTRIIRSTGTILE